MPLNPQNGDAFVQVNLVRGEGYLDVRGALVRQFGERVGSWTETGENGSTLQFTAPVDKREPLEELKIGHQHIWLHFQELASDVSIRQESSSINEDACSLMQVSRLRRQGLRVYRLFRAANIEEGVAMVRKNIL